MKNQFHNQFNNQCSFCYELALNYIVLDKKRIGKIKVPVCGHHMDGITNWKDINTLLSIMGIKSRITLASQIKYSSLCCQEDS